MPAEGRAHPEPHRVPPTTDPAMMRGDVGMTIQSKTAARPDSVTTGPIAGSRKIYTSPPAHPDIRVPFREIALEPTAREEPFRTYDTSGIYTDPASSID